MGQADGMQTWYLASARHVHGIRYHQVPLTLYIASAVRDADTFLVLVPQQSTLSYMRELMLSLADHCPSARWQLPLHTTLLRYQMHSDAGLQGGGSDRVQSGPSHRPQPISHAGPAPPLMAMQIFLPTASAAALPHQMAASAALTHKLAASAALTHLLRPDHLRCAASLGGPVPLLTVTPQF